ncbi:MAG: 5-oxoprolinase subunit PxpA [Opitutus sp.]
MRSVDLNCDLGEGVGDDGAIMPFISSANIACGAHAGDIAVMREVVRLAQASRVSIGAHPGFADRENFGRREISMRPNALRAIVIEQVERLRGICAVRHVKPHGALYNLAARDRTTALIVAEAVRAVDPSLILFGLAGSELIRAGAACGLTVAEEVFGDRTYRGDGSLTPRTDPRALIRNEEEVVAQVLQMVETGMVRTVDGTEIPVKADTICVHGDASNAVTFVHRLRTALSAAGVAVKAFTRS